MPIDIRNSTGDKSITDVKIRNGASDKNIDHIFRRDSVNGDKTIWRRWPSNPLTYINGPSVSGNLYCGGVLLDNGNVLMVPSYGSTYVRVYNPPSGTISASNIGTVSTGSSVGTWTTTYWYSNCVKLSNGRVVLCPHETSTVRVINADGLNEYTTVDTGSIGTDRFGGGAVRVDSTYGERVWFTVHSARFSSSAFHYPFTYIPSGNTFNNLSSSSIGYAARAFSGNGVLLPNNDIIWAPYQALQVGRIASNTDSLVGFGTSFGTHANEGTYYGKFSSGVLLPNGLVLLVPDVYANLVLVNPTSSSIVWAGGSLAANSWVTGPSVSSYQGTGTYNNGAFSSGVLLEEYGKVILIPKGAANFGIYDIATNTLSAGPAHGLSLGTSYGIWAGQAVYLPSKRCIVMTPRASSTVGLLKIAE